VTQRAHGGRTAVRNVVDRWLVSTAAGLAAIAIAAQRDAATVAGFWWTSLVPIAIAAWTGAAIPTAAVLGAAVAAWHVRDALQVEPSSVPLVPLAYSAVATAVATVVLGWRRAVRRYRAAERTDGETGLLHPQEFMRALVAEMERARRYAHPFTLVYISVGAESARGRRLRAALARTVGRSLRATVRGVDSAARMARGDFAVLLPETPPPAGRLAADRLVAAILAAVTHTDDTPIRAGLVTWVTGDLGAERLLQHAYQLMFDASSDADPAVNHEVIDSDDLVAFGRPVPQ
jgi:GGDEF domain-containing protein